MTHNTISEDNFEQLLQYIRITAFEDLTEGTDADWEAATDFTVVIGSKIIDMLGLDIIVKRG